MLTDEERQIPMFSSLITDLDGNSKRDDPISSVEAGEEMKSSDALARHHQLIVEALGPKPMTNMEIAAKTNLNQNQVTRRMTELERRGIAKRGEFVVCPYLKRKVGTWILR